MAEEITRPSVNLLPMGDIEDRLSEVFHRRDEDEAIEGIVASFLDIEEFSDIAVSSPGEDRQTVENALKLGGKPAEEYIDAETGLLQNRDSHQEIRALRDELYQIKNELVKKGFLEHTRTTNGFYDPFREDNIIYDQRSAGTLTENISPDDPYIHAEGVDNLRENSYIALIDDENTIVREVDEAETDGFRPKRTIGTEMKKEDTKLKRNSGRYYLGTYSFMSEGGEAPSSQIQFSTLDDESNKSYVTLRGDTKGYAYTFTISDSLVGEDYKGYIAKFKARVRSVGFPGKLTCYIIDLNDMDQFCHRSNNNAIATSEPIGYFEGDKFATVDFDFQKGGKLPQIKARDEEGDKNIFCALIIAEDTDSESYWELLTVRPEETTTGGLQQNSVLYRYEYTNYPDFQTDGSINTEDFWYRMGVRKHIDKGWDLHREGIYTANFGICDPHAASLMRVGLRINKEGRLTAQESGSLSAGSPLDYTPTIDNIGLDSGMKVVVGDVLCELEDAALGRVWLDRGIYLDGYGQPIYPVHYKILVWAKRKEFDSDSNEYVITQEESFEVPLSYIIPDRPEKDDKISDRLIFEKEIPGGSYNEFEMQIHWKTPASRSAMEEHPELVGRIHELTVSFDNPPQGV